MNQLKIIGIPEEELEKIKADLAEIKEQLALKDTQEWSSQWLTSEEARKMLGVSPKTWQSYRDKGVLPFSQWGRKILVKRADIEEFLNKNRRGR